jgi:RNA polymerase sigma-70 factor (ECF subfamily)
MTDADLIEAARHGDRDAFGVLVERHQRMVEAVAFSAAGQRGLVDDVVQDTFVAAWQTLDRLRDGSRVQPWLRGIARNLARKARRRGKHEAPLRDHGAERTPFDDVSDRQRDDEVTRAVMRLPQRYREPLVLFYYQQSTVKDVAEALALREEAVMQRLSRGRKKLGEALACRVEESLEKRRSRAALVVAVLALLPVRAASARPAGAAAWLAAHWRLPGIVGAATVGVLVLLTANAKSDAIAARAAAHATAPEPARPHSPSPPPQLPHEDQSSRTYRNIAPAGPDAAESCERGTRGLAAAIFGDSQDDPAFRAQGSDLFYEPSPEQQQIADLAAARAAAACGDGRWPELYVWCEGSMTDLVAGSVNCYPYDPFAPT